MADSRAQPTKDVVLITPSYAPDFELCSDLNRSVLRHAPECSRHEIIVYREDRKLFSRITNPQTVVVSKADLLPSSFLFIPFVDLTINLKRPFPPVRGWILQQIVKLAAVAASTDDMVLIVDSDVEFVRPFTRNMFVRDGHIRFYRKPDEVDERLPRHVIWHRVARSLLGLPSAEPPFPDYISSLLAWNPEFVRQMLARVASVTGRPWQTALAGQLHFSESTLYGVFIDHVVGKQGNSFVSDDPLCLSHYTSPLTEGTASEFLRKAKQTDVAVMISSKSRTPLHVKRRSVEAYRAAQSAALDAGP
jgi:hypothetical protein